MDDLEVGMKITVHTGPNYLSFTQNVSMVGDMSTAAIEQEDDSYKGNILEVKAILLPYIVVLDISNKYDKDPQKMDTRGRKFMKITKEYEEALNAKNKANN